MLAQIDLDKWYHIVHETAPVAHNNALELFWVLLAISGAVCAILCLFKVFGKYLPWPHDKCDPL